MSRTSSRCRSSTASNRAWASRSSASSLGSSGGSGGSIASHWTYLGANRRRTSSRSSCADGAYIRASYRSRSPQPVCRIRSNALTPSAPALASRRAAHQRSVTRGYSSSFSITRIRRSRCLRGSKDGRASSRCRAASATIGSGSSRYAAIRPGSPEGIAAIRARRSSWLSTTPTSLEDGGASRRASRIATLRYRPPAPPRVSIARRSSEITASAASSANRSSIAGTSAELRPMRSRAATAATRTAGTGSCASAPRAATWGAACGPRSASTRAAASRVAVTGDVSIDGSSGTSAVAGRCPRTPSSRTAAAFSSGSAEVKWTGEPADDLLAQPGLAEQGHRGAESQETVGPARELEEDALGVVGLDPR